MAKRGEGAYIVTGGAGFVGSNLIAELLKRRPGATVIAVDDFRSGTFANIVEACAREGSGPFGGEMLAFGTEEVDWQDLLQESGAEGVYHLAAITDTTVSDEREMLRVNVEGFRGLLGACVDRDVPLVYASSAATYGSPGEAGSRTPFVESAAGEPNNVYGFSKWIMERMHERAAAELAGEHEETPRVVGLRYFNVYGPGEARKGKMASLVWQLAQQMRATGRAKLFRDGEQARDQVYVRDVVDCTIAAMDGLISGGAAAGVYNLGSGRATSFNAIFAALRRELGVEAEVEYFEMPEDVRAFYQSWTCADMSRCRDGLGWSPSWPSERGIAHYAAWIRERPA